MKTYKGQVTEQAVGKMLLGLKRMKSDTDEVFALVVELTRLVKK